MNPQMRVIVYADKKDYFELDTYILLILFLLRALVNWIIYYKDWINTWSWNQRIRQIYWRDISYGAYIKAYFLSDYFD